LIARVSEIASILCRFSSRRFIEARRAELGSRCVAGPGPSISIGGAPGGYIFSCRLRHWM
jgi:hypothetical protein